MKSQFHLTLVDTIKIMTLALAVFENERQNVGAPLQNKHPEKNKF